jgi:hypothetical protein
MVAGLAGESMAKPTHLPRSIAKGRIGVRRTFQIMVLVVALAVSAITPTVAIEAVPHGNGAEVIRGTWDCFVGWNDATNETLASCQVHNVRTGSGGYLLRLRGQLEPDQLDAWRADGSPRQYETGGLCLANWRFWAEGQEQDMVLTDSVRRFTPRGQMIEVCTFKSLDRTE